MNPQRILIRATNWVGDAVMSLPALRQIRLRFPTAHIAVLAMPGIAGVYARESWANEVIVLRGRRGARDVAAKWGQARQLAASGFDAAVLLTNSFESALIPFAARIALRIGYDRDGRGLLLTHAVAAPSRGDIPRHEAYYYLELLRRAGMIDELPDASIIRLEGIGEARRAGLAAFAGAGMGEGPIVGVSPGAAYGGAKRWLPERFAEAATELARRLQGSVAVFGTPEEAALCQAVCRMIQAPAHNFAGKTNMRDFIERAAACRAFLTNDSGSMHIASALGVPTVVVFGATDHVGTGPTGPLARVVRHAVDCSPYPHPCLRRECPIDHRCMRAVAANEVVQTALDLLG